MVKNLPVIQETQLQSLHQKHPLEKGMATQSGILAWRISMDRGVWQATVHRVTNDLAHTQTSIFKSLFK